MNSQDVVTKCNNLKRFWLPRNTKFKDWYAQIEMIDQLAQTNMESFVGNDPRSSYNLILGMLDQRIPHRIHPAELTSEQITPAAELSKTFDMAWSDVFSQHRRKGRYWLRDLIGFILATGWYSVFALMSLDGSRCIAEVWNPATVFQNWDDEMVECAHIFPVSEMQARRLIARNNWAVAQPPRGKVTIYDYWWLEDFNRVFNAISLGSNLVKSPTHEARFKRIPIFTSPVGGLPDTGELAATATPDKWKGEIGQSLIATNEHIYNYWNKWWTFSMQLLRDTAQARTYEKSTGSQKIVTPETWYRRGAHYKMGPQEEIGFITPPAIPVELRSAQLDMEAMMQRGGPSWAMFGTVQQQMTAYVMSQVAASTNQVSKAYHQGVVDCITDVDNFWYDLMKEQSYKPYGRGLPDGLPPDAKITADYELRIPGDLVQRATTARILNPRFELSDEKVMEELFPEIKNPSEELARIRASKARQHPVYAAISLTESFREEARLLRKARDVDAAELYEKAADLVEASITAAPEEAAPEERGVRPPSARPEVIPPPSSSPL